MTAKKSTKRALISSLLILAMCFTMLAGTTFAWFTDSVTSANNIIKSGKLDMVLEYTTDFSTWTEVTDQTKLFTDSELWEPGYAQVAYIRVRNAGTLALKYKLTANVASETAGVNVLGDNFLLSDYLMFGTAAATAKYADRAAAIAAVEANAAALKGATLADGTVLEAGATGDPVAIVIYMPTTVGNEANYGTTQPEIQLGVNAVATQKDLEADGFGIDYDAAAVYPTPVASATELKDTFADAVASGAPTLITVEDDITDGDGLFIAANKGADITIDLSGNDLVIDGPAVGSTGTVNQALHIEKGNTVVIKNGKIKASKADGILMLIQNYGNLTLDNCEIEFDDDYALSNNCGVVVIKDTTITVPVGKTAFDVCVTNYYPDGTQVTVEGASVINGAVEFDVWGTKPAENKCTLTINGGTFNGGYKLVGLTLAEAQAMTTDNAGVNLFA